MSEESNERYFIEIGSATVFVVDNQTGQSQALFTGPDRLLAATTELNRLNAREVIASAWPGMREELGTPDIDITGTFSSIPAQDERYWIEITPGSVLLHDGNTGEKRIFAGPNRLLAATTELNRLRERDELGPYIKPEQEIAPAQAHPAPAAFLAETLPAVARRQRLEGRLARVREVCECADAETMRWTEISTAASALREKLEKELSAENRFGKPGVELDTPSGPLSATETAQNALEVLVDAQIAEGLQSASEALAERELSKPGPY